MRHALLPCLALVCSWLALPAAPAPHPERPDRLVETRDGFTVEYSPGQEAWMEMAFIRMRSLAGGSVAGQGTPRRPGPAMPGSAQYLQENRDVILAAIARHTGLVQATELQRRTYDTFLGYYRIKSDMLYASAQEMPVNLPARHIAIWQRGDLIARLRTGAKLEGLTYDPATDRGNFNFEVKVETPAMRARLAELQTEIEAQQLKHRFSQADGKIFAAVTPGKAPGAAKAPAAPQPGAENDLESLLSRLTIPIVYRDEAASSPSMEAFDHIPKHMAAIRAGLIQRATDYLDPALVGIILHEAAEIGLIENIISSRDRRWLCDGTANYVAWRVVRDLIGPEFAQQAYDLSAQLRQHAALQPKIDLAAWSAAEDQKEGDKETDLNRAHYAFATRAMFLLAERHGENALAQLWSDVAKTPKQKVSAKTFTAAYRKRFKGDLEKLVVEAEQKPVPDAPAQPQA